MSLSRKQYMLRPKKNKNIVSQGVDAFFDWLRNRFKNVTGFRQVRRRKLGRAVGNTSNPYGYPKNIPRSTELAQKYANTQFTTIYIDSIDNIRFDIDRGLEWETSHNIYREFGSIYNTDEFRSMTKGWLRYKIIGMRLTFTPISANARYDTPLGEGENLNMPIMLPLVTVQACTDSTELIASYMNYNNPTTILNPALKKVQILTLKFNNDFFFEPDAMGWTQLTQPYFPTGSKPRLYVHAQIDPAIAEALDGMMAFRVNIQYKVVGQRIDISESNSTVNGIVVKKAIIEKPNEAKLTDNIYTRYKPAIEPDQLISDNASDQCNHKKRRINKRINIRWDKIFNLDNCTSDSEDLSSSN